MANHCRLWEHSSLARRGSLKSLKDMRSDLDSNYETRNMDGDGLLFRIVPFGFATRTFGGRIYY